MQDGKYVYYQEISSLHPLQCDSDQRWDNSNSGIGIGIGIDLSSSLMESESELESKHNFMLELELESNYSQWNRNQNWNRMCWNRPITDSDHHQPLTRGHPLTLGHSHYIVIFIYLAKITVRLV